ncbi:hypothetical protein J6590_056929 [Homalodisca vitripennis]|nr:hypothetical protein J6590_056929 [Homalodisca vitripennis]
MSKNAFTPTAALHCNSEILTDRECETHYSLSSVRGFAEGALSGADGWGGVGIGLFAAVGRSVSKACNGHCVHVRTGVKPKSELHKYLLGLEWQQCCMINGYWQDKIFLAGRPGSQAESVCRHDSGSMSPYNNFGPGNITHGPTAQPSTIHPILHFLDHYISKITKKCNWNRFNTCFDLDVLTVSESLEVDKVKHYKTERSWTDFVTSQSAATAFPTRSVQHTVKASLTVKEILATTG